MSGEKFISPEPLPSAYEAELLTCLIEECVEIAQRACKIKRFGIGQSFTNKFRLSAEIGDLMGVLKWAVEDGLIHEDVVKAYADKKPAALTKYMQNKRPEKV